MHTKSITAFALAILGSVIFIPFNPVGVSQDHFEVLLPRPSTNVDPIVATGATCADTSA
jgi:hypothetical protein